MGNSERREEEITGYRIGDRKAPLLLVPADKNLTSNVSEQRGEIAFAVKTAIRLSL
jgi:hypothetical protein